MTDLAEMAVDLGVELSPAQQASFDRYLSLLLNWNAHTNLTAIRDVDQIRIRHFLDSFSCARVTGDLNGQRLIDIGTGAGFPGVPLKILYPQLQLTLVDSVGKKTRFLEALVTELGLDDIMIINERAETVGQDAAHREQYDWAVARSVAELRILVELLLPLCHVGGHALAMKSGDVDSEIAAAEKAINALGGGDLHTTPVNLPATEATHYLVVIPKVGPTDEGFPRRPGMPAKRPL